MNVNTWSKESVIKTEKRSHPNLLLVLTQFLKKRFFLPLFWYKATHTPKTANRLWWSLPLMIPLWWNPQGHRTGVKQDMGRCGVFHAAGKRLHSWVPWVWRAADGLGGITQVVVRRATLLRTHQLLLHSEVVTTAHTAGPNPHSRSKAPSSKETLNHKDIGEWLLTTVGIFIRSHSYMNHSLITVFLPISTWFSWTISLVKKQDCTSNTTIVVHKDSYFETRQCVSSICRERMNPRNTIAEISPRWSDRSNVPL